MAARPGALALIGRTPMVRLVHMTGDTDAEVHLKLENLEPSGSVKDRAALAMIEAAEAEGRLRAGATVVEPTSGNTGISLAMICAMRGYRCIVVMPEGYSQARNQLLQRYGAEVVHTRPQDGMGGAIARAREIVAREAHAFMPQQFENPANPAIHEQTTGPELFEALEGRIDAFVTGVGTGGTITGVARHLRAVGSKALVVAVEPKSSAVLSGGPPGLHALQGLGAGFVPEALDASLLDRVIAVSDAQALQTAERLGREEGLLAGPSSGANVFAALQLAKELGPGKRVATLLCDTGERYLIP